jgi:uncharacterized membrane protein
MNILIVVLFTLGARTSKIKTVGIYIAIALLINTLISVIAVIFNINKDNKERIIKNNYKAFLNQPST